MVVLCLLRRDGVIRWTTTNAIIPHAKHLQSNMGSSILLLLLLLLLPLLGDGDEANGMILKESLSLSRSLLSRAIDASSSSVSPVCCYLFLVCSRIPSLKSEEHQRAGYTITKERDDVRSTPVWYRTDR